MALKKLSVYLVIYEMRSYHGYLKSIGKVTLSCISVKAVFM